MLIGHCCFGLMVNSAHCELHFIGKKTDYGNTWKCPNSNVTWHGPMGYCRNCDSVTQVMRFPFLSTLPHINTKCDGYCRLWFVPLQWWLRLLLFCWYSPCCCDLPLLLLFLPPSLVEDCEPIFLWGYLLSSWPTKGRKLVSQKDHKFKKYGSLGLSKIVHTNSMLHWTSDYHPLGCLYRFHVKFGV